MPCCSLLCLIHREKSVEVDLAKKDSANGSYKSPSAVIAAGDASSKVPAKPQPPKKKPVENVDLLGLNEKPPTPLAAPVVKAPQQPSQRRRRRRLSQSLQQFRS